LFVSLGHSGRYHSTSNRKRVAKATLFLPHFNPRFLTDANRELLPHLELAGAENQNRRQTIPKKCGPFSVVSPRYLDIARLQGEGSLIWSMGKLLYDPVAKTDASEAPIKEFMGACPPFRAVIYAMLMSWYDLAVRDGIGEKFEAGRNDLFMAVHLPYCDKFVTAEKYGGQEKCLREVAFVADLETEILSYDHFCDSFLVTI
jgi:hypothetical protein